MQYAGGLVGYVRGQLGLQIASTAPPADITKAFDAAVHRHAQEGEHPQSWLQEVSAKGEGA